MLTEGRTHLQLLADRKFSNNDSLYKVVDFLNKTLKERNLIFGLTQDRHGMLKISIYEA